MKRFLGFCLLFLFISSTYGFGPEALFSYPKGLGVFHPNFGGYGSLSEDIPETGLITNEKSQCVAKLNPERLGQENELFKGLLSLILKPDQKMQGVALERFSDLLQSSAHFYNKDHGHQRKVFSNQREHWKYVSADLKKITEKYLHLLEATDPEALLKARLVLYYYEVKEKASYENEEINENNTVILLKTRHFLLEKTMDSALLALQEILKADEYELKYKLKSLGHPSELLSMGSKIKRAVKNAYRKPERTKEKLAAFLKEAKEELQHLASNQEIHPLVFDQIRVEVSECAQRELAPQCGGVEKEQNKTKVSGLFFHQGFRAYRDYQIEEAPYGHHITMTIPLKVEGSLNRDKVDDKIKEWTQTLEDFYNTDQSIRFNFYFQLTENEGEEVVHLHECFNASNHSTNCELDSQPNAKNFVLDMDKDVILEEVGHRMGLFDEYEFFYYIFNPQGARDSFMVAKENYKIYPHHLKQILLPAMACE